jgi:transcription initiation factor TFIIH subunit 4
VDPSQLAVIVETNYQLVAYTSSSLHVEMLRIFADVRCRLPNVVIGFITRVSIRRAMASGITAKTILSFLKSHTHPAVRARKGRLLPENVEAQIELWHQERARVKFEEVMMIDLTRLTEEDYEDVRRYAENLAVVCWASKRRGGEGGEEDEEEEDEEDEEEEEEGEGGSAGPGGRRRRRKKLLAVRPEALERIRAFVEDRGYTHHQQRGRRR